MKEVREVIQRLTCSCKAVGRVGISPDMSKYIWTTTVTNICWSQLINFKNLIKKKKVPDWKMKIIIYIFRNGDKIHYKNYRGIGLYVSLL